MGMNVMGLGRRMADEHRMRARSAKKTNIGSNPTPRALGRSYSTHGAICSCSACGNPRRHFGEITLAEKREFQIKKDEE